MIFLEQRGSSYYEHHIEETREKDRIFFSELPWCFKDEIKAMKGSRWHGNQPGDGRKIRSVLDCPRNHVQLEILCGRDPLGDWYSRPIERHEFREYKRRGETKPLGQHQLDMADSGLTYGSHIWAAEMRTRKTLSSQIVMENGKSPLWWWVGPKFTLDNTKREFEWWDYQGPQIEFMSFEKLAHYMDFGFDQLPQGLVLDEASKVKNCTSKRAVAAQKCADQMRAKYKRDAYILLLSGTPGPKSPLDWWSLAEITEPGFLREGSVMALEKRLAFMALKKHDEGSFMTRLGWRDDERKCNVCGEYSCEHDSPSRNEVAYLGERLRPICKVFFAKDCLSLPKMTFERIHCPPSAATLRIAKAIAATADGAAQAMIQLRELSDGFQYREVQEGTKPCKHCNAGSLISSFAAGEAVYGDCQICQGTGQAPNMVRKTIEIACAKQAALSNLIDECEEHGRIVIFAGFTGSIDRCVKLCQTKGWAVVRCDGRGFVVIDNPAVKPLDFWSDRGNAKVAFVAHPESGGMGLNLSESRVCAVYSNSFKTEYRSQLLARIVGPENFGCTTYDLIGLPTDERVLDILTENRNLELMTLGEALGDSLAA